jgi:hypothetical protein
MHREFVIDPYRIQNTPGPVRHEVTLNLNQIVGYVAGRIDEMASGV